MPIGYSHPEQIGRVCKLRSRQEITYPFGLPFCSLAASLLNYRTKAMRIRRSLPGNKIAKPTDQLISCRLLISSREVRGAFLARSRFRNRRRFGSSQIEDDFGFCDAAREDASGFVAERNLQTRLDSDSKAQKLRRVQFGYTLITGIGVGGLLGALCLFITGSFSAPLSYILTTIILMIQNKLAPLRCGFFSCACS